MSKKNQVKSVRSKKSAFFTLFILLVALAAAGMAGYFWYQLQTQKNEQYHESTAVKKKLPMAVAPIYLPLDTFTVSLAPEPNEDDRVLYIGLTLRVKDERSKQLIEKFLPDIRSRLLVMFSHQKAGDVSTQSGKEKLIELIKAEVNKPLFEKQSATVNDVLLNAFILR